LLFSGEDRSTDLSIRPLSQLSYSPNLAISLFSGEDRSGDLSIRPLSQLSYSPA